MPPLSQPKKPDLKAADTGREPVKFSVVIDNYNYARYLAQAIDSCLQQTYPVHEVIVVDDGSTDDSQAILARYHQTPRVKVILQKNQGQAAALQHGIDQATGDWILGLDSDDYYESNCLEKIAAEIDGSVDWIYFRATVVNANGTKMGMKPDTQIQLLQGKIWPQWIMEGRFPTFPPQSFHCHSAAALRSIRLFPNRYVDQKSAIIPDTYRNLISSFECKAIAIDAALGCYRDHSAGDSKIALRTFTRIKSKLAQQIMADEIVAEKLRARGVTTKPNFCLYQPYDYWSGRMISWIYDPSGHPYRQDNRLVLLHRILATYINKRHVRLLGWARALLQYTAIALTPKELAWKIYQIPPTKEILTRIRSRLRRPLVKVQN